MANYADNLLWIDLEATSLPRGNDYSDVHIMEVGVILTDLNLNKKDGYTEVVKMNQKIADSLQSNDFVVEMHKKSGLLKASIEAEMDLEQVEDEILKMLKDHHILKGEVAIAGSGVAAYDYPVIKEHMPRLAEMLTYYSYDIGIFRRMFKSVAPRDVVDPNNHRCGDEKIHRAMDDIEDHLTEAKDYQEALTALIAPF